MKIQRFNQRIVASLLALVMVLVLAPVGVLAEDNDLVLTPVSTGEWNGHKYQVYNKYLTWNEAESYCESNNGYLATITSEEEQEYINSLIYTSGKTYYWLGGQCDTNGNWLWITGEPFYYQNWAPTQPDNNHDSEIALMIYAKSVYYAGAGEPKGKWNDIALDGGSYTHSEYGFVCEIENESTPVGGPDWAFYSKDNLPPDAIKNDSNGHYYKVYDESENWNDAKEYCEKMGGHLVTINSQDEQDFLIDLVQSSEKKNMWIGAFPSDGNYQWVTGESFDYTNWAPEEPNNVFNEQNAAMMYTQNASYPAGTWNDENENGRTWYGYYLEDFGYICEWEPDDFSDTGNVDNNDLPIKWGDDTYSFINSNKDFGLKESDKYKIDETLIDNGDFSETEKKKMKSLSEQTWGGSCYGMSASFFSYYMGYEKLKDFYSGDEPVQKLNDVGSPATNSVLHHRINYYQGLQYRDEFVKAKKEFMAQAFDEQLKTLVSLSKSVSDNNRPVLIVYDECNKGGYFGEWAGHAILCYGVEEKQNGEVYKVDSEEYKYRLKILDPNVVNNDPTKVEKKYLSMTMNRALCDIYISEDYKKAAIPVFTLSKSGDVISGTFIDKKGLLFDRVGQCKLDLVTNDPEIIANYNTPTKRIPLDFNVITLFTPKAIINGAEIDGLNGTFDGLIDSSLIACNNYKDSPLDLYVEQDKAIQVNTVEDNQIILFENEEALVEAVFEKAGSAISFDGSITNVTNEGGNYSISIVSDNPLPRIGENGILIEGEGEEKLAINANEKGITLSGTDLSNLQVRSQSGKAASMDDAKEELLLVSSDNKLTAVPVDDSTQYINKNDDNASNQINGVLKNPDGKWAMYKDGKVDTSYTGIAKNQYGWWRVKNGYVDFNADGIYKNDYGWWKTTGGKVTFNETGVFKNDYGWWRVENSKVNFKANGIYQNKYGWWKTTNGKVTFKENGVFKNDYGWWKVKDSKVDFNFTGIASNKYGKWYIKNGKVDFSKNGKVKYNGKTYTIKNGKVQ